MTSQYDDLGRQRPGRVRRSPGDIGAVAEAGGPKLGRQSMRVAVEEPLPTDWRRLSRQWLRVAFPGKADHQRACRRPPGAGAPPGWRRERPGRRDAGAGVAPLHDAAHVDGEVAERECLVPGCAGADLDRVRLHRRVVREVLEGCLLVPAAGATDRAEASGSTPTTPRRSRITRAPPSRSGTTSPAPTCTSTRRRKRGRRPALRECRTDGRQSPRRRARRFSADDGGRCGPGRQRHHVRRLQERRRRPFLQRAGPHRLSVGQRVRHRLSGEPRHQHRCAAGQRRLGSPRRRPTRSPPA